jgi:hypothetical protein
MLRKSHSFQFDFGEDSAIGDETRAPIPHHPKSQKNLKLQKRGMIKRSNRSQGAVT